MKVGLATETSGSGEGAMSAGAARGQEDTARRTAFHPIEFGTHGHLSAPCSGPLDTHCASETLHSPSASASWKGMIQDSRRAPQDANIPGSNARGGHRTKRMAGSPFLLPNHQAPKGVFSFAQ